MQVACKQLRPSCLGWEHHQSSTQLSGFLHFLLEHVCWSYMVMLRRVEGGKRGMFISTLLLRVVWFIKGKGMQMGVHGVWYILVIRTFCLQRSFTGWMMDRWGPRNVLNTESPGSGRGRGSDLALNWEEPTDDFKWVSDNMLPACSSEIILCM